MPRIVWVPRMLATQQAQRATRLNLEVNPAFVANPAE